MLRLLEQDFANISISLLVFFGLNLDFPGSGDSLGIGSFCLFHLASKWVESGLASAGSNCVWILGILLWLLHDPTSLIRPRHGDSRGAGYWRMGKWCEGDMGG